LINSSQTDFPAENRERNWEIYNSRIIEKRTLSHLARQYGLSRERIRQIVYRGERIVSLRNWLTVETSRTENKILGSLTLSTRLRNALHNEFGENWWLVEITAFCNMTTKDGMRRLPNVGNKSLNELHALLEEINPDAANLWASGNGENNNTPKHGRSGPRKRR